MKSTCKGHIGHTTFLPCQHVDTIKCSGGSRCHTYNDTIIQNIVFWKSILGCATTFIWDRFCHKILIEFCVVTSFYTCSTTLIECQQALSSFTFIAKYVLGNSNSFITLWNVFGPSCGPFQIEMQELLMQVIKPKLGQTV